MIESFPSAQVTVDHPVRSFFKRFFFEIAVLIIVFQLTLAASWGWTWMLLWHQMFSGVFIQISAVIGSALLAGLITRVILRDHLFVMRLLSAVISFTISLAGLYSLTHGQIGLPVLLKPVSTTNWYGLWQFISGAMICWLVLQAWNKPRSSESVLADTSSSSNLSTHLEGSEIIQAVVVSQTPRPASPAPKTPSTGRRSTRRSPQQGQASQSQRTRKTRAASSSLQILVNGKNRPDQKSKIGQPVIKPPRRIGRPRTAPIRLVGKEEHRCPYCLDIVEDDDPGGVVVCQICHAAHHKRCWDVSGTCQVPHLQS